MKNLIFILFALLFIFSCQQNSVYNPKPRSFPKVEYPERNFVSFDKDYCSFDFQYPDYAEIIKDEYFFEEKPVDECWFDIKFSNFNGALHCSYIPLNNSRETFDKMVNDAFDMVGRHNIKAQYRGEFVLENDHASGMLFELEGEVASNLQFYLTDSTNHFFRGSLYFNSKVNPDSLAPIYEFVKSDVLQIIESFRWK